MQRLGGSSYPIQMMLVVGCKGDATWRVILSNTEACGEM